MAKRASKLAKKAKKSKGLSHAKMKNIQKLKRIKNKEYTPAERKARKEARKEKRKMTYHELRNRKMKELRQKMIHENEEEVYKLTAEITGEEMISMLDPEELTYMVENNKKTLEGEEKENKKNESGGNEEEKSFEQEERSFNPYGNDMKSLLPYKTEKGIIQRYTKRTDEDGDMEEEQTEEAEVPAVEGETAEETTEKDESELIKDEPKEKSVVELMGERQLKLERKKVAIGCLAVNFLERPDERLHCLATMLHLLEEKDPSVRYTVRKYVALSLLEMFHKTIPAYHIQPHDLTQKLKKETKEQYLWENHFLKSYQTYLKGLEEFLKEAGKSKSPPAPVKQLELVSLRCMGELLVKHSHFTYTNNIISALIPYLNHKDDQTCHLVIKYLTSLFKDDVRGDLSLEAVKRIDHFIRKRGFKVRVEMLSVLLSLRIKNLKSVDEELEAKNIAKKKLSHTEKLMRKLMEERMPKKSNKEAKKFRKFRKLEESRKEQKQQKEEEVRTVQHTQLIEIIFGLYFHILKRRPNNKLNAIVLESLAKFSHLVNIDFFSDLLDVLAKLMEEGTLKFRESLHCIQTVFTILSDQGEVLTIDPRRFYSYLYANLLKLTGGENQDDLKSALQSLMHMLVKRRKRVSVSRVTAFIKRLTTLSVNLMHNGALASLATARYIMLTHPCSEILREPDSEGSCGVYNPEVEEPEHCNASDTCLWELHLLNRHYHSSVRQFADHIARGAPLQGEGQLPANLGKRKVEDLYDDFDPSMMKFNPSIPSPSQIYTKKKIAESKVSCKRRRLDEFTTQYMNCQVQSVCENGENPFNVCFENPKDNPKKQKGFKKNGILGNGVDYFSCVLPNMNLKNIKSKLPETGEEDATVSLVDVDTRT